MSPLGHHDLADCDLLASDLPALQGNDIPWQSRNEHTRLLLRDGTPYLGGPRRNNNDGLEVRDSGGLHAVDEVLKPKPTVCGQTQRFKKIARPAAKG